MLPWDSTTAKSEIESCLAELSEFVATLEYAPKVLVIAMGVQLQSYLSALLECDQCTREQIHVFLQALEQVVFEETQN
jgi:hypothetical protein